MGLLDRPMDDEATFDHDSKRSQVKKASNREYKSILPRGHDAASDIMALQNMAQLSSMFT